MLRHYIGLFIILAGLWLSLSGEYSFHHPLVAITGTLSCALVTWLAWRMDIHDRAWSPLRFHYGKMALYNVWLLKEIILANLDVSLRIIKSLFIGTEAISPGMRTLKTSQSSNAGRVIFANSITLTPGTVSVYVEKGEVTIHALSQASANSYEDGSMDARVSALEIKGK